MFVIIQGIGIFIENAGISQRYGCKIIYLSDLEPLYYSQFQFDQVESATICTYKLFKFCNKFETTTDMSKCPSRQFKHYISHRIRKGIRFRIIVHTLIAMVYRYQWTFIVKGLIYNKLGLYR